LWVSFTRDSSGQFAILKLLKRITTLNPTKLVLQMLVTDPLHICVTVYTRKHSELSRIVYPHTVVRRSVRTFRKLCSQRKNSPKFRIVQKHLTTHCGCAEAVDLSGFQPGRDLQQRAELRSSWLHSNSIELVSLVADGRKCNAKLENSCAKTKRSII
jgi:hypothetical protein